MSVTHAEEPVCLTCADDATACVVVRPATGPLDTTLVRTELGEEEVDTSLVGELRVGDTVLVHAKTAILKLSDAPEQEGQA